MFCAKCGEKIAENVKFCGKCGTTTANNAKNPTAATPSTTATPTKPLNKALFAIPAIAIIIAVGGFLLLSGGDDPDPAPPPIVAQESAIAPPITPPTSTPTEPTTPLAQAEPTQADIDIAIAATHDFLSQYLSIFRSISTWHDTWQEINDTTIASLWSDEQGGAVYVDNNGHQLVSAPFLEIVDGEYLVATEFTLLNLHGNGIPSILIEFRSHPRSLPGSFAIPEEWQNLFALYTLNGENFKRNGTFGQRPRFFYDENGNTIFSDGFEDFGELFMNFFYFDLPTLQPIRQLASIWAIFDESVHVTRTNHQTGVEVNEFFTFEEFNDFENNWEVLIIGYDLVNWSITVLDLTFYPTEMWELQHNVAAAVRENLEGVRLAEVAETALFGGDSGDFAAAPDDPTPAVAATPAPPPVVQSPRTITPVINWEWGGRWGHFVVELTFDQNIIGEFLQEWRETILLSLVMAEAAGLVRLEDLAVGNLDMIELENFLFSQLNATAMTAEPAFLNLRIADWNFAAN